MIEQYVCLLLGECLTDDDIGVQTGDLEHSLRDGAVLGCDDQNARPLCP